MSKGFRLWITTAVLAIPLSSCTDHGKKLNSADAGAEKLPSSQCSLTPSIPLRLLTRFEFGRSVADLLGNKSVPSNDLPPEPLSHGLDNDATLNIMGDGGVLGYFSAAKSVAQSVTPDNVGQLLADCQTRDDIACGKAFIRGFGLRAFRRPLTTAESASMDELFFSVLSKTTFDQALRATLTAFLQSPQFLFRTELGEPNDRSTSTLSSYELAAKLSYFITSKLPDAALLAVAASGDLDTVKGLQSSVERLASSSAGMDGLGRFFTTWLSFDKVENSEKDPAAYGLYSTEMPKAWRTSLDLFIKEILTKTPTVKALLSSSIVFVNRPMMIYATPESESPMGDDFVKQDFRQTRRGGLLTQPGFLAFKALHDGSSPVRRGIFILDKLLCEPPPPPPADRAIVPPPVSKALTTRQRFDGHKTDPTCASCHRIIDPVGYTFENFDGLGAWRDTENGQPINAIGGVSESEDPSVVGTDDTLDVMLQKIASSRKVHDCIAGEVYRYAMGRPLTVEDECSLAPIRDRFFNEGGNLKMLVADIAASPAFRNGSFDGVAK